MSVDGENGTTALSELTSTPPTAAVEAQAREAIDHSTVAKYLFTSGSTGMPKGVPQTHGMFAGVIAGTDGLRDEPTDPDLVPQSLEWMPWSHISAGNISFNGVMWAGGTLHLDEGKPIPGQFETTIRNLYEVSPTGFGSAPVAFGMLAEAMEQDPKLRRSFFKNMRNMGYGGATLSNDLYDRLQALAIAETGLRMPLTTMYGATETQGITVVHWLAERVGLIGLPLPGITLKLVPNGSKLEVRVKGPTVTSGYHNDPEKTAAAFDEEGFYRLGDAARFVDPEDPSQGLVFDGRVTEDFKLDSGTWVSVGTLRPDLVAACSPYAFDMVITGQDKAFAGALIWPSPAALPTLGENPLAKLVEGVLEGAHRRVQSHRPAGPPAGSRPFVVADRTAVHRWRRDHRQGLWEPCGDAGAPQGAGRRDLRQSPGPGVGGRSRWSNEIILHHYDTSPFSEKVRTDVRDQGPWPGARSSSR